MKASIAVSIASACLLSAAACFAAPVKYTANCYDQKAHSGTFSFPAPGALQREPVKGGMMLFSNTDQADRWDRTIANEFDPESCYGFTSSSTVTVTFHGKTYQSKGSWTLSESGATNWNTPGSVGEDVFLVCPQAFAGMRSLGTVALDDSSSGILESESASATHMISAEDFARNGLEHFRGSGFVLPLAATDGSYLAAYGDVDAKGNLTLGGMQLTDSRGVPLRQGSKSSPLCLVGH